MTEAAFNTIAEIQRLRDAGFEQQQAEAITLSIHSGVTGGVATKADIDLVRTELDGKIDLVRMDVEKTEERLDGKIDLLRKDVEKTEERLDGKIDAATERLDGKIDTATERLDGKIEKAKFELTWKLLGGFAVLNGIMFALFRYLPAAPAG